MLAVRMNGPIAVGTTFESDVRIGKSGSFSPRCVIAALEERRRLGWVSLFPLGEDETEDHQIAVHWTFDLEATPSGTRVAHTVHIPPPKLGSDELAEFFERTDRITTMRTGMVRTLENIKTAAQPLAQAAERPAAPRCQMRSTLGAWGLHHARGGSRRVRQVMGLAPGAQAGGS